MKKQYIYIPLNIILILLVLFGVGFLIFNSVNKEKKEVASPNEVVASSNDAKSSEDYFSLAIVQHSNNDSSNQCYQGLIAKLAQRGYTNSNNIDVTYILETDEDKLKAEIDNLLKKKVDVIYSIGSFATEYLKEVDTKIPVVFAAISDPEGKELIESNEVPGGMFTGVSSFVPTFEQIESIKFLLPKAKSVGAIYDSTNETSVTQAILAQGEAESKDIGIEFSKYPISGSSEISSVLDEILEDEIEIIYLPDDEMVSEDIGEIMDFCLEHKIPTICGSEAMLVEDGFSATIINYTSIGRNAADIVVDIAVNHKEPANIPVSYNFDCDTIVNKEVMEALDIELSADAKKKCEIRSFSD